MAKGWLCGVCSPDSLAKLAPDPGKGPCLMKKKVESDRERHLVVFFFFHVYTDVHEFIDIRNYKDDMALVGILASVTDTEQLKIK